MSELAKLVIKRFPENRNMQLVCLRDRTEFHCSRCKRKRRAKLLAVVAEDWGRLLCAACYEKRLSEKPEEPARDVIPKAWLGAVVSLQDAERNNMRMGVPFGNQALQWEEFRAAMLEGDEVCEFSGPSDSSEQLAGSAGYALVRNGSAVRCIVTVEK